MPADGICKPDAKITVTHPRRGAVRVDADGGLGHLPTYRAMDEACAIAQEAGIGMAVVVNSTHFGAAGAYAMAAAEAGFIGFATCNSGAFVVPFGGKRPLHGTSPISLAAPRKGGDPFLLDMATSSVPWNKVMRYRTEGLALPADVALDEDGRYTTDPNAAVCLGPLGGAGFGYKGAGLAGMAEMLSAALTGMRLGTEQSGVALGDTKVGHFVMAIDPDDIRRRGAVRRARSRLISTASHASRAPCRRAAPNGRSGATARRTACRWPMGFMRN